MNPDEQFAQICVDFAKDRGLSVGLSPIPEIDDAAFGEGGPVFYSRAMQAFDHAYQAGFTTSCRSLMVQVMKGDATVAYWPVRLTETNGLWRLTSYGGNLLPPKLQGDVSAKLRKSLAQFTYSVACKLHDCCGYERVAIVEYFAGELRSGLSEMHGLAAQYGYRTDLEYDLYVDLRDGLEGFRRGVRKSYKPLISGARNMWRVQVDATGDVGSWAEFRDLHRAAAGRDTRSAQSWDVQFRAVQEGCAFLVALRDEIGRMVGAGYFDVTADHANYSVAAYDRRLFDKPLGHLVQAEAVGEILRRNIRWYRLGAWPTRFDHAPPDDKQTSIAFFKQGFSNALIPRYIFQPAAN